MRSKLIIALGGILAGLVTMPVDAFVVPFPMLRRTVPRTGFGGDQLMMVNLPDVRAISNMIVPPIPKQEAPINRLSDQFRPRFVAKEFLIGFRYMLRMYTLLIASSALCSIIRSSLPLPEGTVEFGRSSYGACHTLEMRAKIFAANTLQYSYAEGPLWYNVCLGPFLEEMSYRGFGHMLGRLHAVSNLLFFALLCRCGPGPATAWCGFCALTIAMPLFGVLERKTIASVFNTLGDFSDFALMLPVKVFIINMLRKQKEKSPKAEDASIVVNVTSGKRKNATNMITTLALGTETKAAVELERKLEKSFSRSARFWGAREFGAAHSPMVPGGLPLREALRYLQKGFGTFASSLLVESRLVVNRRNIWGAVGAHVAFNAMANFLFKGRPLVIIPAVGGPAADMPLSVRFSILSVNLLILRICLGFLCNILQKVEDKYLS
jgi:hypothetical protein